jgi:hypothetical protein
MSLVKIDVKKNIPQMDKQMQEAFEGIVDDYSFRMLREMQVRAPVRTGALQSGLRRLFAVTGDRISAKILSTAPYTMIVEKGSRPHIIVPKNVKALRFTAKDGSVVFAKSVRHHGTVGRFFIRDSIEAAKSVLPEIIRKHLHKVGKI